MNQGIYPNEQREIGERVRSCRILLGLTKEALAKKSGVSHAYLARIESGGVHPEEALDKLAEALHTERKFLLGKTA